ncbi:MAG TPA: coenzyme F420-0:L-glutamate ligase [Candidatus Dormibacteraeota bacterium]
MKSISIHPIGGLPEIKPGMELASLLADGMRKGGLETKAGDVLVVTQKVVSKAEGRTVRLSSVKPTQRAGEIAARISFDPRHVEVILSESVRVVREAPHVLITETRQGFVCANAGVDRSNAGGPEVLVLLPEDSDASARRLREQLSKLLGIAPGVVISDSFGRAWREGQVNVAIGCAGVIAIRDYRGGRDTEGYELQGTMLGVADELASAAELVMGKLDRVPAALIRGAEVEGEGDSRGLLRDPAIDLFR